MYVHRSNRTEQLVEILCDVVRRPLATPFEKECIVVQGRGMERWLSMQLASRLGVWANPEFPFPRKLVERAFAAATGESEDVGARYQPETLSWAIADLLPAHLDRPSFVAIRSYLASDGEEVRAVRLLQLAERIASTFDQYVVYRPELVLGWQDGAGEDWQPVLWRALVERLGNDHLAAREARFARAVEHRRDLGDFPKRVSLFGLSTLPPLYVRVLFALSRLTDVHLFLLSPSNQYWAEIQSRRERLRTVARATRAGREPTEEDLHLTEGNPLLASLGRLGRDFQAVLEGGGDYVEGDADLYDDPGPGTLLGTLQSDVLNLRERRHEAGADPAARVAAIPLAADDGTVAVHSCHSPMREVEVLHDQLSRLFEQLPGLEARDVIVMTPAIDTYAPLVEAVFGETGSRPKLPYRVADRGVRSTDEIVDAFSRVLDVLDGRMTATDVLDLLRIAAVRRRFGIEAQDVELLCSWVDRSGIRWGIDAQHRAELDQPPFAENTWRFGLDRLLLGYAMPADGCALFASTLPYDDVEGSTAELLGKLAELCGTLFRFHASLRDARPLAAWRDDFGSLLEAMIQSDDATADQHNEVRKALSRLVDRAAGAGFVAPLTLDAVRPVVLEELTRAPTARGFLSGGITFCEMVPMRAIPFRVVCLLGMNGDAFPRIRRPLGFDLVARRPRRGDRSAREDDRYLFLEALLSARDRLLISYVGQSIRDNAELPPSVVVSELLDALGESFVVPEATDERERPGELPSERAQRRLRARVVLRHPLQPFSTRYFSGDARLFSYARGYHSGAEALLAPRSPAPAFVRAPLATPADAASAIDVADLVYFFQHPARHFLQRRLLVSLGRDAEPVENREPLLLDQLASWAVGDQILKHRSSGHDARAIYAALRASGVLPLGSPGSLSYGRLMPEVEAIAARANELRGGAPLPQLEIDGELDGTRVTGVVADVYARSGQVRVQFSRLRRRSELASWVQHLVLQCFAPDGYPRRSLLVGRTPNDGNEIEVSFRDVDDAGARLSDLLALYRLGTTRPLPLFPTTSRLYTEAVAKGATPAAAVARVRGKHRDEYNGWGDGFDAYNALAFSGGDVLDGDPDAPGGFHDVARRVFAPLLAHREAKP